MPDIFKKLQEILRNSQNMKYACTCTNIHVQVYMCNKGRVLPYIGKYLIPRAYVHVCARECMWVAKRWPWTIRGRRKLRRVF